MSAAPLAGYLIILIFVCSIILLALAIAKINYLYKLSPLALIVLSLEVVPITFFSIFYFNLFIKDDLKNLKRLIRLPKQLGIFVVIFHLSILLGYWSAISIVSQPVRFEFVYDNKTISYTKEKLIARTNNYIFTTNDDFVTIKVYEVGKV